MGVPVGMSKITPKWYQDPVLWAWLETFVSPRRYQFLHLTLSPVIFFPVNTLKGTAKASAKASAVDLLRLNTLRVAKNTFLIPKLTGK